MFSNGLKHMDVTSVGWPAKTSNNQYCADTV